MKFWLSFFVAVFFLALPDRTTRANGPYEYSETMRKLSFRLVYPLIQFDESQAKTRQLFRGGGIELEYSIYLWKTFGLSVSPFLWFLPIRMDPNEAGRKATFTTLGLGVGPVFSPWPKSFLDPTFIVRAGVAAADAGSTAAVRAAFPMEAKLSLDVYKDRSPYQDDKLALSVFGAGGIYLHGHSFVERVYFNLGIAFKGTF